MDHFDPAVVDKVPKKERQGKRETEIKTGGGNLSLVQHLYDLLLGIVRALKQCLQQVFPTVTLTGILSSASL